METEGVHLRTRFVLALLAFAATAALVAAGVAPGASIQRAGTTVVVTLKNSAVVLSRTSVPAGAVTLRVANKGTVQRTFSIAGKKVAVKPGGAAVVQVTLGSAGKIAYISTATGKATLRGSLSVTATGPTTAVAVAASELKFDLSRMSVPVGTVVFTITNKGGTAHNFSIAGKVSDLIGSGQTTTLKVAFTKPGSYPYLCTIPGHAEGGMKGVLTVT
jgi:plastocyanin